MKSATLPSFWSRYRELSSSVKAGVRKAYRLWAENPFHPSLHLSTTIAPGFWCDRPAPDSV